jgi:hypothetical protein
MEVTKIKKSDWCRHLELAKKHSRGIKGYCRENGIKNSRFHYWKNKLENRSVMPVSSGRAFAAVEVVSARRGSAMPDPKWLAEFLVALSSGGVR